MKLKKLLLFLLIFLVGTEIFSLIRNPFIAPSLQSYADRIYHTCETEASHQECYQREVPQLLGKISLQEAFTVTKMIQDQDPSYKYCHILGHQLAEKETAKDPSKWKDVVRSCPIGVCSNGCQHGALLQRFRSETLSDAQVPEVLPDLQTICDYKNGVTLTSFDKTNCYHGLGHLTMYITGGDINRSVIICDQIFPAPDRSSMRHLCYEGLFMQLFQPLEPEDEALVKGLAPAKSDLRPFCERLNSVEQVEACWQEGWPLYDAEVKTPQGLVKYCSVPSKPQQFGCYMMLFHVISQFLNFNEPQIAKFCNQIPSNMRGQCYANAASATIESDRTFVPRVLNLCSLAQDATTANECYKNLALNASYNLPPSSAEFTNLCNSLPQPWKTTCLGGN